MVCDMDQEGSRQGYSEMPQFPNAPYVQKYSIPIFIDDGVATCNDYNYNYYSPWCHYDAGQLLCVTSA